MATEVDVDEQQPATAVKEHDVVVVEMEAAGADKHEPALASDSDCIQDKP